MAPDWCHSGGMDLTQYVENLRGELAVAADAGGEDARELAERLTAALDPATRLMLLDALSAAADEITRELAPGSVELRLRSGEPGFVVTPAPADEAAEPDGSPRRRRRRTPTRRRPRASTCACPSSSRPASSRPRPASGCPSTRGSSAPPPRRWRTTIAARGRAAGARRDLHRLGALSARPSRTPPHRFEPEPQEGLPMPTFDTPQPDIGHDRPRPRRRPDQAGDRATTVVDVRPSDPSNAGDVRAAEQTRVDYTAPQLLVRSPKLRSWSPRSTGGSIDVTVELPAGSRIHGSGQLANFDATARSATAGSRSASATSGSTASRRSSSRAAPATSTSTTRRAAPS